MVMMGLQYHGGRFLNVYIMCKCTVSRQLDYFSFYEFSIITVIMYNFSKNVFMPYSVRSISTVSELCADIQSPYKLIMNH